MDLQYIVYWVSEFDGTSWQKADQTKANMMMFDHRPKAEKFRDKLAGICEAKETYRGRIVTHVCDSVQEFTPG